MSRTTWMTCTAVLVLASSCASAAAPERARTETVAAIRAAQEVGALSHERSGYHLELAQEQLTRAEHLIQAGRMIEAERMLARAQADAELAIVLTREAVAQAEAEELEARITAMRERL